MAPVLKAITYRLDGKYTSFDHNDLYQEAVFYLWRQFKERKLDDKTSSFILQGCYYFLKNYIRKSYKKIDSTSVSLEETNETLEKILSQDNSNNGFEFLEEKLLIEEIEKNLTKREKEICNFLLEGFTTREIGKQVGISHVMVVQSLTP